MGEEFGPNNINIVAHPNSSGSTTVSSGYSIVSPDLGQFSDRLALLKEISTQSSNGVP
jgi:hypothetical protein